LSSLRSRKKHSRISWSLELAWYAIVIAGSSFIIPGKERWLCHR
jgi:hypothetical protein